MATTTTASPEQELRLDLAELEELLKTAKRDSVKSVLTSAAQKTADTLRLCEQRPKVSPAPVPMGEAAPAPVGTTTQVVKKIPSYSADLQDSKYVTLFVPFEGAGALPASCVRCNFGDRFCLLSVTDPATGVRHELSLSNFHASIVPASSSYKVSSGGSRITIRMKKAESGTWPSLEAKEQPKMPKDKDGDPDKSLRDMLKKMYDEGDEDTKRLIAQSMSGQRK